MDIILDEKEKAEEIINNKEIDMKKPTRTIQLLIKYYKSQNKGKEEIRKLIEDFMQENYSGFNSTRWQNNLDRMVNTYSSDKYQLIKINKIKITQGELNKIEKLDNIDLEKLAFSLLVYAKVGNQINKNNNNWVNVKKNKIIKDALIKSRDKKQKYQLFRELHNLKYIRLAKATSKTGVQVLFVDEESKVIIEIEDFKEFISEYLKVRKGYCIKCGKKIKTTNNKIKYCNKCAKEINIEKTIKNRKKLKNV